MRTDMGFSKKTGKPGNNGLMIIDEDDENEPP